MPRPHWTQSSLRWLLPLLGVVALVTLVVTVIALQPRGNEQTAQRAAERDDAAAAVEQAEWDAQTFQTQRPEGRPLSVAMYGDSITFGWDASSQEATYREIVRSGLANGGAVDLSMQAVPGATTGSVLAFIDPVSNADISVVALGLNDYANSIPIDEVRSNYARLLGEIRAAAPDTALLCSGIFTDARVEPALSVEKVISEECEAAGGKSVAIDHIYLQPGTHDVGEPSAFEDGRSDGFHPTDRGMRMIAYRILERFPALAPDLEAPDGLRPSDPSKP
jgi:lysophospholipase L1-like esterase